MELKQIAILTIFVIFGLPLMIQFLTWNAQAVLDPSPENIQKGGELMADAVTPWWIGIMEWFAGLPALLAAILIIAFAMFLRWIGEIND